MGMASTFQFCSHRGHHPTRPFKICGVVIYAIRRGFEKVASHFQSFESFFYFYFIACNLIVMIRHCVVILHVL